MNKNPRITKSEIALIKRAKEGDIQAFNKLYYKYKKFVANMIFQYTKDREMSKDLADEVFVKVYNKLSTFVNYQSFGGWLRTIANHVAIDYLRKIKSKEALLEYDSDRLSLSHLPTNTPEDELVTRTKVEELYEVINSRSEATRKVFKLFYKDNMTIEMISNKLRMPVGTIKSILSRTRNLIRKRLNITKQ